MKAEMKATIGEFFDVRVGEADAAAALPASSEACSLVVVCAASEAPGVTGSPRQALKVRTSTPRIFTGTDLIGTTVAEGRYAAVNSAGERTFQSVTPVYLM